MFIRKWKIGLHYLFLKFNLTDNRLPFPSSHIWHSIIFLFYFLQLCTITRATISPLKVNLRILNKVQTFQAKFNSK